SWDWRRACSRASGNGCTRIRRICQGKSPNHSGSVDLGIRVGRPTSRVGPKCQFASPRLTSHFSPGSGEPALLLIPFALHGPAVRRYFRLTSHGPAVRRYVASPGATLLRYDEHVLDALLMSLRFTLAAVGIALLLLGATHVMAQNVWSRYEREMQNPVNDPPDAHV